MSCHSCTKSYSLFRKEKSCPGCGFGFCSKCLDYKIFLPKLNTKVKVCKKCKELQDKPRGVIKPPDAYFKRLNELENNGNVSNNSVKVSDIEERLNKLKDDNNLSQNKLSTEEIQKRLQNLKSQGNVPTEAELRERLAKIKDTPYISQPTEPCILAPDTRTDQQQADDLIKQYVAQTAINKKYEEAFDTVVHNMEARLQMLKGLPGPSTSKDPEEPPEVPDADLNNEEVALKIIQQIKLEDPGQDEVLPNPPLNELPFCEICNEDAEVRCLGCRYLFCKQCYLEHEEEDDCNKYVLYKP